MTKTKYYDLQMDDSQDNYDVEVVNANLKKIDEQMKTRENATDALQEPEFTVADKRENIASKEKISKILGKIAKFFTDLKKVAFTGDYADLTNKPTYGKGFITDKSGSITINLDGETITLDQAKNVIKLADTLKDKIGDAFPSANVANNQVTTEAGFALDARQANPNIDGTLAKQVADLNGSLKNSQEIRLDTGIYFGYIGSLRFSSASISNGQKIQLPDGIVDILGTGLAVSKGSNNIYVISVGDANIQIRDNNWNIVQSIENIRGGLVVNVVY